MLSPRCPACGKHFAGEEVSNELLHVENVHLQPSGGSLPGQMPLELNKRVETFGVTYKCKHCGHRWTDISEKDL